MNLSPTTQRLHTKVTLVTGAGSGIGRAVAVRFAAEGARVVGLDLSTAGLAETAELVRAAGGELLALPCDVTKSAAVQAAVTEATTHYGQLDAVFSGVGASGRRHGDGPVDACSEAGWAWTLDVNLTSMFLVCKHCVPHLLQTRGAVVALASVLGMVGGDDDFATHAYAASKAGVIGLARAMAAYYAARGLRVNVLSLIHI